MSSTIIAVILIGLVTMTIVAFRPRRNPNPRWYVPAPDEPRCDITGQRLTPQQQYDRECG